MVSQALKNWLVANDFAVSTFTSEDAWKAATQKALDAGTLTSEKFTELQASTVKAADVFGNVRLKKPSERYSETKSVGKHFRTGEPVRNEQGAAFQHIGILSLEFHVDKLSRPLL